MDPFDELPMEIIQTILSFFNRQVFYQEITPQKTGELSKTYIDPKEAVQKSILSKRFQKAFSTIPNLYFADVAFSKLLLGTRFDADINQDEQVEEARERFAIYVDHTLTRYQQYNLPIRSLVLETRVVDGKTANILEQCLRKAKEHRVKHVCLNMSYFPAPISSSGKLLQSIFALRDQLHVLELSVCDSMIDIVQDNISIELSSLRILKLTDVKIDEGVLHRLIHCSPMIKEIKIWNCQGPKTIQVANIPTLMSLHVCTVNNQTVDVKAKSLEIMNYQTHDHPSPYMLSIEPTQNLKKLSLKYPNITDEKLHSLISKFPLLEVLCLEECYEIQKINVSSHVLSFLRLRIWESLMEVKIYAPNLEFFEYNGSILPSLSIAAEGCEKRKSRVLLGLGHLEGESSFLELSEFLMNFRRSDIIELVIVPGEISFDIKTIDDQRECVPEFEEVFLTVSNPSTTYSSLMDGLLWSFSPKILTMEGDFKQDEDEHFIKYLCEELLVEHDPNISDSSSSACWRNYFTHAMFKERDDEWRPLHNWKSLEEAMQNLGDSYTLKLSHA